MRRLIIREFKRSLLLVALLVFGVTDAAFALPRFWDCWRLWYPAREREGRWAGPVVNAKTDAIAALSTEFTIDRLSHEKGVGLIFISNGGFIEIHAALTELKGRHPNFSFFHQMGQGKRGERQFIEFWGYPSEFFDRVEAIASQRGVEELPREEMDQLKKQFIEAFIIPEMRSIIQAKIAG